MSIASQIADLATRVGGEFKGLRSALPKAIGENRYPGRSFDVRALARTKPFTFDGVADDLASWAEVMTRCATSEVPSGSTIIIPGLPSWASDKFVIPAKRLRFVAEPGFTLYRRGPHKHFEVATGLDRANMVALTGAPFTVGIKAFGNTDSDTSNSTQTNIPIGAFADTKFKYGALCKIVSEAAVPGQILDSDANKRARMGYNFNVISRDPTTGYVTAAGEIDDNGLYTVANEAYVIPFKDDLGFEWLGGDFVGEDPASGTAWLDLEDVDGVTIFAQPGFIFKGRCLRGSGKFVNPIGCVDGEVDIVCRKMGNKAQTVNGVAKRVTGYGVVFHASTNCTGTAKMTGDSRHASDENDIRITKTTLANRLFEAYGACYGNLHFRAGDRSGGHSPVSPHVLSRGTFIALTKSMDGVAGQLALGAGISMRARRGYAVGHYTYNRPVAIEVNDQVADQCIDNTIECGFSFNTSTAVIACSVIETGSRIKDLTIRNHTGIFKRGVGIVMSSGRFRFEAIMLKLYGTVALTNFGFVVPTGDNNVSDFVNMVFDCEEHTGTGDKYVVNEQTPNKGQVIRFINCTFRGSFKALVNAATPTAIGADRPRYEFIDCDRPANVPIVDNRGTAEVVVRDRTGRNLGRVPPNRLLGYAHVISGSAQAGAAAGFNFLAPIVLDGLNPFDAIEFPLTAAAAGGEARLSVYGVDPNDMPGFKIATLGTIDLSTLPAQVSGVVPNVETLIKSDPLQPGVAVPWVNKRAGKFWLLGQLKPLASQASFMRLANVLPGFIFPIAAEQRSNGNNFPRCYNISVGDLPYGTDSPEVLPGTITALDAQTDNFICWLRRQAA